MDYGSPAENQNKGYAKQEKKDLLNDNPIAKDASGGRSWMSKHSQSGGSPLKQDLTMDSTIGDVGKKIKNTTLRTAAEGVLNSVSSGAYKAGKDLYNKMKQRDGGQDDMMKTRKEPIVPGERVSAKRKLKNQEQETQPAGAEKAIKYMKK
jgi:hypothetical protein